jgi:hypothetical protein
MNSFHPRFGCGCVTRKPRPHLAQRRLISVSLFVGISIAGMLPIRECDRCLPNVTLADYYRKTDPAQASKLYNQVKQDFPDTPAAEKADEGLELLNAKT